MITTDEALKASFEAVYDTAEYGEVRVKKEDIEKHNLVVPPLYWSFKFGENNEYELCFERLIMDDQMYVALYKDTELLLNEKVVVKPGYSKRGAP